MANKIILKKSGVTGKSPFTSNLSLGEIAINYADGYLFYRTNDSPPSVYKINAGDADTVDGYHLNQNVLTTSSPSFAGLTVDTNTLYVDATNNRIGVNTTSPNKTLTITYSDGNTSKSNSLSGATAGTGVLIHNNSSANGSYANLDFRSGSADGRILYSYNGTGNSGDFHFVTDDTATFGTKLFIGDSGDVGIGTIIPSKKLHVDFTDDDTTLANANGITIENQSLTSGAMAVAHFRVDTDDWYLGNRKVGSTSYFFLTNETAELLTVDNLGNVGIGTTSPASELHVKGGIGAYTSDYESGTAGSRLLMKPFAATGNTYSFIQAQDVGGTSNNALALQPYGDNVGIGTSSPNAKLEIKTSTDNSSVEGLRLYNPGGGVGAGVKVAFGAGSSYLEKAFIRSDMVSGGNGRLFLGTNATDRLVISEGGSVGIGTGTTSPTQRLEVYPDSDSSAIIGRAQVGYMQYGDYAGFSHLDVAGTVGSYALLQQNDGTTYLNAANGKSIYFRINNGTKATINASGLTLNVLSGASTDTDRFLVSDGGVIKYRTGSQLLSDIGALAAADADSLDYVGNTISEPVQIYNPWAVNRYYDGIATNRFHGRSELISYTIDGGTAATLQSSLTDANYDGGGVTIGTAGGSDVVYELDFVTNGLTGSSGFVYSSGQIHIHFYPLRHPEAITARVKKNDGTWTSMTMTGYKTYGAAGDYISWRGTMPFYNYATAIEFTLTPQDSSGNSMQITEIEYHGDRMALTEGGLVTKAGGDIFGDLSFNDNYKAKFGTGNDLQIYHDGSNSYIADGGTGSLYAATNAFRLVNSASNENMISAYENGAVSLYYDNASKLATASTGVNVTGNVNLDFNSGNITWGGDTDTSIYASSNVTSEGLRFKTGGATRLVIADDGNIRIGNVVNPSAALDVHGKVHLKDDGTITWGDSADAGLLTWNETNDNKAILRGQSGYELHFGTNGTASSHMMIDTSGNIGIGGVIVPSNSIHTYYVGEEVSSLTATASDTSTNWNQNAGLMITGSTLATNGLALGVSGTHADYKAWIQSGNPDLSSADDVGDILLNPLGGKVGIGTTSPQEQLHVNGGSLDLRAYNQENPTNSIYLNPTNGNGTGTSNTVGGGVIWKTYYNNYTKKSAGILAIGEGNYFRTGLAFYTNNSEDQTTDWSERMRIDKDGNVGIGTTDPADKLEVQDGNIRIQTTTNTDAKLILNPYSGTIGTGYQWELVGEDSTSNYDFQIKESGTPYLTVRNSADGEGDGGNVGIGTTSPASKLEVDGQVRVVGAQMIGDSATSNVVASGVQLHIKNTGEAKIRLEDSDSSNLAFDILVNEGSGFSIKETVGGDSGDDTRLVIQETTGYVGIGTPSPSKLLTVNGEAIVSGEAFFSGGIDVYSGTGSRFRDDIPLHFGTDRYFDLAYNSTSTDFELRYQDVAAISIDSSRDVTIANDLTVSGDLTVTGTTTYINTDNLQVEDNNIELGKVALPSTPSNSTANNGGITLLGGTDGDKKLTWTGSSDSWIFNTNLDVQGDLGVTGDIEVNGVITNPSGDVRIESVSGREVEIASTRDIRLLIDSNNDDTTNRFEIQSNTSTSNDSNIVFVVEQDGKTGIGTASPQDVLHIKNSDSASDNTRCDIRVENGFGYSEFGTLSGYARIQSDGTEVAALKRSASYFYTDEGVFGAHLGASDSGDGVLTINGGGGTSGEAYLKLTRNNVSGFILNHASSSIQVRGTTDLPMQFWTNNSVKQTILSNGNVGIGITNPSQKLEVAGNIYTSGSIRIEDTGDQLEFGNANVALQRSGNQLQIGGYDGIVFKASNTVLDSQTERMRITVDGDVGINDTTPSYKLDVNGGIKAGGKVTYTKSYSSGLDTTGQAVAAIGTGYNGESSLFEFTCFGGSGGYQKVVWSMWNVSGTWYSSKVIDEGTNTFDVTYSGGTFTFKARSSTQAYTPRVVVEASGDSIDNSYA